MLFLMRQIFGEFGEKMIIHVLFIMRQIFRGIRQKYAHHFIFPAVIYSRISAKFLLFLQPIVSDGALAVSVSNGENGMVSYTKWCYQITRTHAPALVRSVTQIEPASCQFALSSVCVYNWDYIYNRFQYSFFHYIGTSTLILHHIFVSFCH